MLYLVLREEESEEERVERKPPPPSPPPRIGNSHNKKIRILGGFGPEGHPGPQCRKNQKILNLHKNPQNFIKFHDFYGRCRFYVKFSGFRDLGGNTYDFGFIFILFRAKCENDDFCVEIVARELVLRWFHVVPRCFQLLRNFAWIPQKTHLNTYVLANAFHFNYQTTAGFPQKAWYLMFST